MEAGRYIVEKSDLMGDLENSKLEVVQFMVEQQIEQGNAPDVRVFWFDKRASFSNKGFDWSKVQGLSVKEVANIVLDNDLIILNHYNSLKKEDVDTIKHDFELHQKITIAALQGLLSNNSADQSNDQYVVQRSVMIADMMCEYYEANKNSFLKP